MGFEPTFCGLEGRRLILARPRALDYYFMNVNIWLDFMNVFAGKNFIRCDGI